MDELHVILLTFFIWFFAWHSLQTYMKSKHMNRFSCYSVGLVIVILIYSYFNNLDKEDNE